MGSLDWHWFLTWKYSGLFWGFHQRNQSAIRFHEPVGKVRLHTERREGLEEKLAMDLLPSSPVWGCATIFCSSGCACGDFWGDW